MTTTAVPPPTAQPSPPVSPPRETAAARAARLQHRRRLLLWSSPVVLLLLLVALKLLTMVAAGQQAAAAHGAGSITSLEQAGRRLGVLNVVERHKAPFALGDAAVLSGDFGAATARFEQALAAAPGDGLEACQVRVNLVLSLEQLGDAATAASGAAAGKPFYDRVSAVAGAAPAGCFRPQGQGTGQQLDDARTRTEQKAAAPQPQPGQDPSPGQDPQQPSPDKQQQLDQKTKDNQAQRAQGDQGERNTDGGSLPQVDKPW